MLRFAILLFFISTSIIFAKERSIMVFAGSASEPPTKEVAKAFEKRSGIKVNLLFGGSGYLLSQMRLSHQGDIYFPGSSDYMEIAKAKGAVVPNSQKIVAYLVPAINVAKGNPKNIKSLKDLTKPDIKVAIANPKGVCVGIYAIEILEKSLTKKEIEQFRKNLINYTSSCSKTANAIALKQVDAVIGWRVFKYWNPNLIETIPLKKEQIARVGYIPIAISKYSKNPELAKEFIDFMTSKEAKEIFAKYHYFTTPKEAFDFIGAKKPIGGEYRVPKEWLK